MGFFGEFFGFLRARKKLWLLPLLIVLILVGALVLFAKGSVVAPFIYTVF